MVREGRVFISPTGKPEYGIGYYVTAYEVGAQVASASSGTTATVRAGHGFAASDKLIVGTDATRYRRVTAVTSTTLTLDSAISLSDGDLLVNLAQDTGSTAPKYDGNGMAVYSDMYYANQLTYNTVLVDSFGKYRYFHKGIGIWELVKTSTGTPIAIFADVYPSTVNSASNANGSEVIINGSRNSVPGYTVGGTSVAVASNIIINRPSTGAGSNEVAFCRDEVLRWALGEDYRAGDRSYFAILSDKGQVNATLDGFSSGDILGIGWGGADTNGQDGPKWSFNGAFNGTYDAAYQYQYYMPGLRTSGDGIFNSLFQCQNANVNSGGLSVQLGGTARVGIVINNQNTTCNYAAIQMGHYSDAVTFHGFEIGTDLAKANTQNFSIYDVLNSAYRMYIAPSGNVGIGTTVPDNLLHVWKDQNDITRINVSNASTGTLGGASVHCGDGSTGPAIAMSRYSSGYTGDATLAGDGMLSCSGASTMLHFGTGGTKRVSISATAAKVGIGVDPPVAELQVNGGVAILDGMTAPSTLTGYAYIYVDVADGDLKVKFGDGTVKTIVVDT